MPPNWCNLPAESAAVVAAVPQARSWFQRIATFLSKK